MGSALNSSSWCCYDSSDKTRCFDAQLITRRYETRLYRSSRKVRMRRHGLEELDVGARPDDLIFRQRTPQECERLSSVLAVHDEFRDLALGQRAFPVFAPVTAPRQSIRLRARLRRRYRLTMGS
jgi:hypothetical protein